MCSSVETGKTGLHWQQKVCIMPPPMHGGPMGRGFLTDEEKANRPKVTFALIRRIFSWLLPYMRQLLLILACIILSSVLNLFPSVLTGKIIDDGLIGQNLPVLVKLILLSLAVTFGANLIGVGESYLNTWVAQHITFDMRNQMYRHLQQMSQRFFTSSSQGDIITRMTSDIDGVERIISNTFTSILSNAITLIVAIVMMYNRNWILATVALVIVPLFTIPTRHAGKTRWTLTREAQECNDQVNGILNETLSVSGQLLVKLFGKEDVEYERYRSVNERMIKLNIRERIAGRWFFMILVTFTSIGPMLIYLIGGILMMRYDARLTVGDISVMVALLGACTDRSISCSTCTWNGSAPWRCSRASLNTLTCRLKSAMQKMPSCRQNLPRDASPSPTSALAMNRTGKSCMTLLSRLRAGGASPLSGPPAPARAR